MESACRHNVKSLDGIGSHGFAQITWKWWKKLLKRAGISEVVSIEGQAKAQAFILRWQYKRTVCKKLFEMYQRYNGGGLVSRELRKAHSCKWEDAYAVCNRKDICVWRAGKKCKQWRNACDINYEYSLKIFQKAQKYRLSIDSPKYPFW
jgi:hypothetical protein